MAHFIVFEGLDGSGKSTQARLLTRAFGVGPGVNGILTARAHLTREPTNAIADEDGVPIVYSVTDPHAAALLFAADRRLHQDSILANLDAGIHVVCDRYSLSMQAYQNASGVNLNWLIDLDKGCRVPDLTIYLNLPPEMAFERLTGKTGPNHNLRRLEYAWLAYSSAIAWAQVRREHVVIVDAKGTEEEVHLRVLEAVATL